MKSIAECAFQRFQFQEKPGLSFELENGNQLKENWEISLKYSPDSWFLLQMRILPKEWLQIHLRATQVATRPQRKEALIIPEIWSSSSLCRISFSPLKLAFLNDLQRFETLSNLYECTRYDHGKILQQPSRGTNPLSNYRILYRILAKSNTFPYSVNTWSSRIAISYVPFVRRKIRGKALMLPKIGRGWRHTSTSLEDMLGNTGRADAASCTTFKGSPLALFLTQYWQHAPPLAWVLPCFTEVTTYTALSLTLLKSVLDITSRSSFAKILP